MSRQNAAWWFLAPALIVLGLFFLLPVIAALLLSLTDYDLYALADVRNLRFVALANYWDLLHRPLFWSALGHTFYFVIVGVPLSIATSLGAALLLNSPLARFKPFFRTALFAPVVTTVVAVAVIWRYLFNTKYGWANYGLSSLGIDPIDWLGDPHWAMPTIILFAVWKNFGYNMIIFLAGLQAIPADLYEAARIDGASVPSQFRHITLPMLAPTLLMVSILTVSGYFQLFAEPYVMTQGGPADATNVLQFYGYKKTFAEGMIGYGSAIAVTVFLMSLVLSLVYLRAFKTSRLEGTPQ